MELELELESVAVGLKRLLPPGSCVNDVGPEEGRSSNNQSPFNHAELIQESRRKAAVSSTKSSPTQIYPYHDHEPRSQLARPPAAASTTPTSTHTNAPFRVSKIARSIITASIARGLNPKNARYLGPEQNESREYTANKSTAKPEGHVGHGESSK